ncbi:hypothetical protein AVEN_241787-1 [Araneus ventricosus]|uniref:Uncharacterized protein n=1 Tax=Araneus ventricosus TaxID=182803 RepID=A0A4Y1ZPI9_ARAVE|nr:hypothetical protein AVEN_241787-1 [Araneus ventricosus]
MFGHKALLDELCSETLEFRGLFFFGRIDVNSLCIPLILLAPSVSIETILFISSPLSSRHFCTTFAISSPRVCPQNGSNPSSSSFGPWDDIYLTKRVTCAVSFMSQDSSIASDKAEAS